MWQWTIYLIVKQTSCLLAFVVLRCLDVGFPLPRKDIRSNGIVQTIGCRLVCWIFNCFLNNRWKFSGNWMMHELIASKRISLTDNFIFAISRWWYRSLAKRNCFREVISFSGGYFMYVMLILVSVQGRPIVTDNLLIKVWVSCLVRRIHSYTSSRNRIMSVKCECCALLALYLSLFGQLFPWRFT